MGILWHRTWMDLDELAAVVAQHVEDGDLIRSVKKLVEYGPRTKTLGDEQGKPILHVLCSSSKAGQEAIEAELLKWNLPPRLGERPAPQHVAWILVSYVIFRAKARCSDAFCKSLINRCLTQPTDLAFALTHADAVSLLAKQNPTVLSPSLVEITITSNDDSRSHYALRLAEALPQWADVRGAVLDALLHGNALKKAEARSLVLARGNAQEIELFAKSKGISLPAGEAGAGNLRKLTNAIARMNHHGSSEGVVCALRSDGVPVSPNELLSLSRLLARVLKSRQK